MTECRCNNHVVCARCQFARISGLVGKGGVGGGTMMKKCGKNKLELTRGVVFMY
jgi:hypothetical protein